MKKKTTVSIGIPAYNEGANIQRLLTSLLSQKQDGFTLKEILVVSDGSSDDTVEKVLEIKKAISSGTSLILIDEGKRLGKSARLQQIFQKAIGDVLFIMDADIIIKDNNLLVGIMSKVDFRKAGLVGVNATPLAPLTRFESFINTGVAIATDIAKHWQNGRNYLFYKGCFMGVDVPFAKSLSLSQTLVSNDAFLYFSAIFKGYSPVYLSSAKVYYRSPTNFSDHLKQSSRYRSIREEMKHYFLEEIMTEPASVMFFSTIRFLMKEPVKVCCYLGIRVLTKLFRKRQVKSLWDTALSTKMSVYEH